ncbi:SIMPL domain-containing protein [Wenzhouxiangella marina]|uniref:Uncharacterized protein n=1 Tax=Wenzhouxiangella marina TaxID=1579979 RepID=A0A0K0XXU9_9GAMM|nr:SIMPL domain-containing protein [Wenzhouxiangella marina]AKS42457.1 hypothetical protein WM2015_2092 [Wenzhouxiangella marina]MBB6085768.1 hypothetical protein [Wenzhouxiangella marina]
MRLLALSLLLLASPLMAQGNLPSVPHVYVQGSARVPLVPELLVLSGRISATDPQVVVASQQVEDRSAELVELARSLGVEREDLRASMPTVDRQYEYRNGENVFVGYRVSREVEIQLSNMETYHLDYADIVRADVVESLSARFTVRDPEAAKDAAQLAAIDDARARAERLAERGGAELGSLHSITEFDLRQVEARLLVPSRSFASSSMAGGGDGIYTTSSRMEAAPPMFEPDALEAQATVYVVFLLKGGSSDD